MCISVCVLAFNTVAMLATRSQLATSSGAELSSMSCSKRGQGACVLALYVLASRGGRCVAGAWLVATSSGARMSRAGCGR